MALHIIGLGLFDEEDITLKGIDAVRRCERVFLENYTAVLSSRKEDLEKLYGKKIELAGREMVESHFGEIIDIAKSKDVALLVVGDALSATTHSEILLDARKKGVSVRIIHNASVFTAVAETGLQLYKFGRTTSIPFPARNFHPENFYDVLKENKDAGAHTLLLLDLKPSENRFMTVDEAIRILFDIEHKRKEGVFTESTMCVGCARLGGDSAIKYGTAKELLSSDLGAPMHCLIVPGKLHFAEEEMLLSFKST